MYKIMKKRIASFAVILMAILTSHSLFGQESQIHGTKLGIGVSLLNLTEQVYEFDDEPTNTIYITMDIGRKFRFEPIIGFAFTDGANHYSFGFGGFGRKTISKFNILYGLRLALNSNQSRIFASTIGGEYYFIKNFSIGSEVQLTGSFNDAAWAIYTKSSVMIRFYF
jgi:hypothetical protein